MKVMTLTFRPLICVVKHQGFLSTEDNMVKVEEKKAGINYICEQ